MHNNIEIFFYILKLRIKSKTKKLKTRIKNSWDKFRLIEKEERTIHLDSENNIIIPGKVMDFYILFRKKEVLAKDIINTYLMSNSNANSIRINEQLSKNIIPQNENEFKI